MNKENIKWIYFTETKKERVFTPLNNEKSKPLVTEDKNNPDFVHVLSSTIYDVMKINAPLLFKESANEQLPDDFFSSESWQDFRRHAEMLTTFLTINKKTIDDALNEFEEKLIILAGGKKGVEKGEELAQKGFQQIQQIEHILKESGIAANGDNGGVIPEIKIRHFLDLLNPAYKAKVGSKTVEKQVDNEYNLKVFIDMLLSRDKRKFSDYIGRNMKLGTIINSVFDKFGEPAREIFRKIVSAGNYQKNGAQVGKAELALAMFFCDCKLPNKKGDIQLVGVKKNGFIEIKGSSAVITARMTKSKRFEPTNQRWGDLSSFIKSIPETVIGQKDVQDKLSRKEPPKGEELGEMLEAIDNAFKIANKNEQWATENRINSLKFAALFGALFRTYASLQISKNGSLSKGFNEMWIFNTDDDLGDKNSNLLDSKVIKVIPNENVNWYEDGLRILNSLAKGGVNVEYANAHGESQYGFKAKFDK